MPSSYIVAVVGGACAGSQIASDLADLGMEVVVIEQNDLPYGKIEDGLPRWHRKLQEKEMKAIDAKLNRPEVHFLPRCRFGTDLTVDTLRNDWGIPLVIMANGAWRDRAMPMAELEAITDHSFVYQNPFVYWFNHYHEPNFQGRRYSVPPGPVVVGGGLASIDVAKICQFEMVRNAALERGHELEILEMEHKGVFKTLEKVGLNYDDLNITPAKLYYRKRVEDMPLVPLDDDATAEKREKAKLVRAKLIKNATTKYGFEVYPLHSPVSAEVENGSLKAVEFAVNDFKDGRFRDSGERVRVETGLMISSIGSLPMPIAGIPMDGELYAWESKHTGAIAGVPGVFGVGNALTGRGNIRESNKNAKRLGAIISAGVDEQALDYEKLFQSQREAAKDHVQNLLSYLKGIPEPNSEDREKTQKLVKSLQNKRGYTGDYQAWKQQIFAARGIS